jgi:predicted porin
MQKHIIAAAVAAAVAVPAMAQVKVSGNVEAGYASAKKGNAVGSTYQQTGLESQIVGTPVIRFSGSEDLGGGLKANFQLDFEFNADDGTVDGIATTSGGGADLGVSTVGLSGGFGSLTLGKGATRARDGGGIYRFFGNQGRLAASSTSGAIKFTSEDERESLIEYVTPTIQGFSASVAYHGAGNTAAGAPAANGSSASLRGRVGPATFQVGQERQTGIQTANTTRVKAITFTTVAANANLGMARVGLVYVERYEAEATTSKPKATGLHVAVPMSAFTVGGSYTDYRGTASGSNTKVMALNGVYALSKRTAVHGTYQTVTGGTVKADIMSSRGLNVGEVAGQTNAGYAISVVHSF